MSLSQQIECACNFLMLLSVMMLIACSELAESFYRKMELRSRVEWRNCTLYAILMMITIMKDFREFEPLD